MDPKVSSKGRTLKPTEKGASYQLATLNDELQKKGRTLMQLITDPTKVSETEKIFGKWKQNYVLFVQTGNELCKVDQGQDTDFMVMLESVNAVKVSIEEYLMANSNKTDDGEHHEDEGGKPPADDQDRASNRSSTSSVTVRGKLSLLRLQEVQKKVELASKIALLKKKQEIEKKKMELKWQEEQLDLETEIEVNVAKAKLIEEAVSELDEESAQGGRLHGNSEDYAMTQRGELQTEKQEQGIKKCEEHAAKEGKMQQQVPEERQRESYPKDYQGYTGSYKPQEMQQTSKRMLQETQEREESKTAQVVQQNREECHNQPRSKEHLFQHPETDSFAKMMKSSRLPVLEPDIFCGTVSEFPLWLKSFEAYIEQNTDSCIERLHYLGKYTGGQARKAILGFLTLRSGDAYEKAKCTLVDRYGNEFSMASAYRERIRSWPVIRNGDAKGLQEFVDFLSHCQSAISECHSLYVLDDIGKCYNAQEAAKVSGSALEKGGG